jgi:hypothetical protein
MNFSFLYLGDFIINFIFIPWHFQWIFYSSTLGILGTMLLNIETSQWENLNKNRRIEVNEEYLWNAGMRSRYLFWPFKMHNNRFKQALDHEKRWRIEQLRESTYQNSIWGISFEQGNMHLSDSN